MKEDFSMWAARESSRVVILHGLVTVLSWALSFQGILVVQLVIFLSTWCKPRYIWEERLLIKKMSLSDCPPGKSIDICLINNWYARVLPTASDAFPGQAEQVMKSKPVNSIYPLLLPQSLPLGSYWAQQRLTVYSTSPQRNRLGIWDFEPRNSLTIDQNLLLSFGLNHTIKLLKGRCRN